MTNKRGSVEERDYYSLKSLVPEIMEYDKLPKGASDYLSDNHFEADYQAIRRMYEILKKKMNLQNAHNIPKESKDAFVAMMKRMRKEIFEATNPTPLQKSLKKKMKSNEQFTEEELEYLITLHIDIIRQYDRSEEGKRLLEIANLEDEFISWQKKMMEKMSNDLSLIGEVKSPSSIRQKMREFERLYNSSELMEFRDSITQEVKLISKIARIASENNLDLESVLLGKNPEELIQVISTMLQESYRKQ